MAHSSPPPIRRKLVDFAAMVTEVDQFGIESFQNWRLNEFFAERKGKSPTKKYEVFSPQDAKSVKQALAVGWENKIYQEQCC